MTIEIRISEIIPAPPEAIYEAWLSSRGHSDMTGGEAHSSGEVGGAFDAWNGYIAGTNLALEPRRRIVQSWRTTKFTEDEPDSQIELTFEPVEGGTLVTLHHTNVPDGGEHYEPGWKSHYFEPMKAYFGQR